MFSTEDLKTAIGATVIARRNAAARLREAGNPRDPFRALPGMEQQFFEAAQSVRSYDLVLNLLEREVKREARKRAGRTAQSAAAFLITAGLITLATLGFAAALLLMRCPVPAVSVTAFIAVFAAMGTAHIRIDGIAAHRQGGFCHDIFCLHIPDQDAVVVHFRHVFCTSNTRQKAGGSSCTMLSSPMTESRSSFMNTGMPSV